MSLQAEQIDDVVRRTLNSFPKPTFKNIAARLTDYPVVNQMMRKGSVKLDSSQELEHRLQVETKQTTKNVGLYADDSFAVQDGLKIIKAPWRHTTDNYIYDYKEKMFNTESPELLAHKLVDLLEQRECETMLDIVEHLELAFWGKPTNSDDSLTPWGIQYWLSLPTSGQEGRLGGNISGFSDGPGGLSADTYDQWKSYVVDYDGFTDDKLSRKMRKAWRAIRFHSPVPGMKCFDVKFPYKIMTGETVQEGFIDILRSQNDNIGKDLGEYDGMATFKRVPMQYVPSIDEVWPDDASGPGSVALPIFMLNTNDIKIAMHTKNNFRRTGPTPVAGKHDVRAIHIDITWNLWCTNRRSQCILGQV